MINRTLLKLTVVIAISSILVLTASAVRIDLKWHLWRSQHANPQIRAHALRKLGEAGDTSTTRSVLLRCLADDDLAVVEAAIEALTRIGARSEIEPAIIALVSKDGGAQARIRAIELLTTLGPESGEAINSLKNALDDTRKTSSSRTSQLQVSVRQAALRALGAIGAKARTAVPDIVILLPRTDFAIQSDFGVSSVLDGSDGREACQALAAIGPAAQLAVPMLRALLKQSTEPLPEPLIKLPPPSSAVARQIENARRAYQIELVRALGNIGNRAALPELQSIAQVPHYELQIAIATAIWQIDRKQSLQVKAILLPIASSSNVDAAALANHLLNDITNSL